ncbi:hypothetical protein ACWGY7_14470 [Xanthomonas axonopodis pv. khayae]|uniref:hypothetical protein n=1 Tax=Xanthomonas axonopodis TaxID=53413 RepID=UPI00117C0F37|nr:hypothetical protein [Xanthomonas axonopodis]
MDPQVEAACDALEEFAVAVAVAVDGALASVSATLLQHVGWMGPALTRDEVAAVPRRLAKRLKDANFVVDEESEEPNKQRAADLIASMPGQLTTMAANLANLVSGNVGQAGWAYFETFNQWERALFPGEVWAEPDPDTLPSRLRRQLKITAKALDSIVVDRESLEAQIKEIKTGAQMIGDLPVDAEMLVNARKDVAAAHQSAVEAASQSKSAAQEAESALGRVKALEADATKVLDGIEAVYRATTSHALAEAFNSRGNALRVSVRWWVGLLILALGVGAYLGYLRVQAISDLTKDPSSQQFMALIWVQVALGTLSLAAPLWVAWLATRQISQRFRLAEDYSFKASLATAYEGYRREAARIDPDFEKDLFGSALRHLDQEPLRFMSDADHGSPYSEFFSSPLFRDALKKVPNLSEDLKAFVLKAVRRAEHPARFRTKQPPSGHQQGHEE